MYNKDMSAVLSVISMYFVILVGLLIFLMFYVITFKCFLKTRMMRGIKKIGIIIILTIINPFGFEVISEILFDVTDSLIVKNLDRDQLEVGYFVSTLVLVVVSVLVVVAFAFLYSSIVRGKNTYVAMFSYLMFSAFFASVNNVINNAPVDNYVLKFILNILIIIIIVTLNMYFYKGVIIPFSKLDFGKNEFNWKFFIFPPIAILFLERIILLLGTHKITIEYYVLVEVASVLILTLSLMSFSVMIKNIVVLSKEKEARTMFKELSVEMMEALAHTIDAKDEYTKGHSTRVAKYSRMLAEKMGMNEEECENVYYMALLHDIGKIGVPNEIINSPNKLTDEEYDVIKTHPGIGYDILSEIKIRPDLSIGARWHHERYDGKGYPDGKSGDDLPIWARIIAVADSYDAMTSNRSYRKYMPQDAVREELVKNSGTQFDPDIAEQMIAIIDEDKDYILHE